MAKGATGMKVLKDLDFERFKGLKNFINIEDDESKYICD